MKRVLIVVVFFLWRAWRNERREVDEWREIAAALARELEAMDGVS